MELEELIDVTGKIAALVTVLFVCLQLVGGFTSFKSQCDGTPDPTGNEVLAEHDSLSNQPAYKVSYVSDTLKRRD